ncbi:MAG TPA: DUF481 domain-containing protein, partial [Verrucomicrobiota bacterium]|nr:DUF481 domain-containing protein [Verrucomicrobiota bacterium]
YAMFITSTASKRWGRTTSFLNYNLSYGVVNGVENANRMAGDTKVDVEFSRNRKLYTFGLGGAGYDTIRDIDLEYHVGGGLGYKFIDRQKLVVAAEVGAQYQAYDYDTAPDKKNVAARFGQNLTTQLGDKITLTQRFGFTPGLDDLSDYQIRFGLTLSCPLFKPLTLNLNIANEYDSQPAPGITNNDLQVSTTIGIIF